VDGVVLPAAALLDTVGAPLGVAEELALGEGLGQLLGENNVPACVKNRRKG
jgi:hypothetical protein